MRKTYTLGKSRRILHHLYAWFKKKGNTLTTPAQNKMEGDLRALENAIFEKNRPEASALAKQLEATSSTYFKKSIFSQVFEIGIAIVFALCIATVVRQMWFELYEIPTGSMRPSFREQDRLTVTKTTFGLNIPLETEHLYFDPNLVERGKVLIFSGANIPELDEETKYFGVLPYTKRYIKRLIGKPGDALYFYGGNIYGVDRDGKPIEVLLEDPWMKKIEHIPFITFEGEISVVSDTNKILFLHFNRPIGKLSFNRIGTTRGEINANGQWGKEHPFDQAEADKISSLSDFWGIGNFAMARLLTKEELKKYTIFDPEKLGDAELYLQLKHSPNLTYPPPRLYKEGRYMGVQIPTFESIIPLKKEAVDKIMDNMYTARFVIKDGRARRYNFESDRFSSGNPSFAGVPDGTYEFYHGKAEKVGFSGWTSELSQEHPLNKHTTSLTQALYNLGIEMLTAYEPNAFFQSNYPHRYAYFRDGDLYLLGAPILKKDDPALQAFVANEKELERKGTPQQPYMPFIDRGAPLKDGKLDTAFIKNFGIKVPEKHYLVLGDNHAMSKDSRIFGFVPEQNLQGAPSFLIWPPGSRWGFPPQTAYPFINVPRLIVWSAVALILLAWYLVQRRRYSKRLFPK